MTEAIDTYLISAAREAMQHAHAPYSRFAVGAALRLSDGSILTGSNFENASYGLSLCAETVAIASANAAGRLGDIVRVAVVGGAMAEGGAVNDVGVITPCGRCRQIIAEVRDMTGQKDLMIDCASASGAEIDTFSLNTLLPNAFGPAHLGIAPIKKDQ